MIGPYEFPPKFVWTNGAQSSLKVSVLTGLGPWSDLPWFTHAWEKADFGPAARNRKMIRRTIDFLVAPYRTILR